MSKKAIPALAWFIPLAPITFAAAIYFGEQQSNSFLLLNRITKFLPDALWAWLTFFGNGWGVFALSFPLLLLAPRLLTAGIFGGAISAISSTLLKNVFDLPRPASVLEDGTFYRIGEPLLHRAFPSGHTLTAFAIASALYFAASPEKRRYLGVLFLIAALVGLSRNAVGAHWLTDVMAGAGVGMWCGMIGTQLTQYIPESWFNPRGLWSWLIALGGVAAIYAHFTQVMDLELNLPLQYASITIIVITLVFFLKAQLVGPKGQN